MVFEVAFISSIEQSSAVKFPTKSPVEAVVALRELEPTTLMLLKLQSELVVFPVMSTVSIVHFVSVDLPVLSSLCVIFEFLSERKPVPRRDSNELSSASIIPETFACF